jgi:hypothetical protein
VGQAARRSYRWGSPPDLGERDDLSEASVVDRPRIGCILLKRKMRPQAYAGQGLARTRDSAGVRRRPPPLLSISCQTAAPAGADGVRIGRKPL